MVEASSASQAQASAVAAASPKSASNEAIQMPNLDSFAAKLNSFAVVLSEKAKSRPVTVGNVGEIESAIAVKKVGHRLFVKQRVCLIWLDCFEANLRSVLKPARDGHNVHPRCANKGLKSIAFFKGNQPQITELHLSPATQRRPCLSPSQADQ